MEGTLANGVALALELSCFGGEEEGDVEVVELGLFFADKCFAGEGLGPFAPDKEGAGGGGAVSKPGCYGVSGTGTYRGQPLTVLRDLALVA